MRCSSAITARLPYPSVPESIRQVYVPPHRPLVAAPGEGLLGLIGYGGLPGDAVPPGAPCALIPLNALGGQSLWEAWYAPGPVEYGETDGIRYASNGTVLLGMVQVPAEQPDTAAYEAYLRIIRLTRAAGYPTIFRMWNYLPDINREQLGLERYRRFSIGRYQAFAESGFALGEDLPAASAIGSNHGDLWVIFAAGRGSATQIENPRQVSAFRYPPEYGPRSPLFSRAMAFEADAGRALFISGTASILGHETVHPGDLVKQCATTVENLRAILDRAGAESPAHLGGCATWKVYLRHPRDYDAVRACLVEALDPASSILYLAGDICRDDLLVEIEGVVQF